MTYALWIFQGLLALLFLFAGVAKLIMPIEEMTKDVPMPGAFLRFIAVAEVLGAIGLVLPSLLRIKPGLTPLAAAGLAIIMIGATVVTLTYMGITMALVPLVVGLLWCSSRTVAGGWRRRRRDSHARQDPHRSRGARRAACWWWWPFSLPNSGSRGPRPSPRRRPRCSPR